MGKFAKVMLMVSAGVFVSFMLVLVVGTLTSLKLLNVDWFYLGFGASLFGVAVVDMIGLVLCGLRRDWRSAVILLIAVAVLVMTPLVYGVLLLGTYA